MLNKSIINRFKNAAVITLALFALSLVLSPVLPAQETGDVAGSADSMTVAGSNQLGLESEEAGKIDWGKEILRGEEVSYVLIVVAVAGLAFFLERLYSVRRAHFVPARASAEILRLWQRGDFEQAQRKASGNSSIFGRAAAYIASHTHLSFEIVSFTASDMVSRGIGRQLQRSYPLAIVATVSPLLGLLGTIIGMIEAFQKVAIMGDTGDASVLADSIGKALITTALGLIIAIPSLSAYHYFKMKTSNLGLRVEEEIDTMLSLWLQPDEIAEPSDGDAAPKTPPADSASDPAAGGA